MSHKPLTDKQLQQAARMFTMGGGTYGAAERVIAHVAQLAFENGLAKSSPQALALWQSIETAPKTGHAMLLGYKNSYGKWQTVRGKWISKEEIEGEWDQPEDFDAGWYEAAVEADDVPNCWPVAPTHWMLLPAAPGTSPSQTAQSGERAKPAPLLMSGWQLLEALDLIAPDRDTDSDQLDGEIALQMGGESSHSGAGLYAWDVEYPEEGSSFLAGESAADKTIDATIAATRPEKVQG
ncbi:hypothetical protein [Pandoraea commovens]|uniref:DUF551 domain-containing protein n=1 Tax=Pandoraea commovens TaxID=2508289 RepID=A0ABY5QKM2_9BURK|nr:hypothetical protein [Pandoraea commovens]UVA80440.1 hypothetical protein NTU39_05295 [Pandoraea commovens]